MRPEKADIVNALTAYLKRSPYLIVADYHGLKVDQFSDLRTRLAGVGARCQVVKNTFLHRATQELGMPDLRSYLTGQTAVVTGDKDVTVAAKVLQTFTKDSKKFTAKVGVLDNRLLTDQQIQGLADMPSKEVLQAQLLGLLQTPASQLVRLLNEPGASLARLLQASLDKQQQPAAEGAPVAEAAAAS